MSGVIPDGWRDREDRFNMPELMTVEELGKYLRFTRKTIYRLLKQGSIPAIKIGNKWRFDKAAIDRWLNQYMEGVKAHILVIDDDEMIRSLFKKTLEEQGHTVVTAGNGAEGIECVKKWDFDLVFLDLKMPRLDGDEFLKQLKAIKPELPVTIITGYPGSEMMERALKQGPFGVMGKPFDSSDIINAVNSFLKARQPRR
ncbi:MAG: response regulator [Dehalococcoidales bacterium]|nr:response regulator [Dehalococcoidales bacterium]